METLKINEIFYSIQGESSFSGWPTVFIRTSGCHLRCDYCDTTYAYHEGNKISVEDILAQVKSYGCQHICLTGGEPLLQKASYQLLKRLCDLGYQVSLETSGDIDCQNVDPRVLKVIDIKTPDSGESDTFNLSNLKYVGPKTEFKFVICSHKDFVFAEEFIKEHKLTTRSTVYYSPSFKQTHAQWLAESMIAKKSPARLQLQLHKFIWPESQRGV